MKFDACGDDNSRIHVIQTNISVVPNASVSLSDQKSGSILVRCWSVTQSTWYSSAYREVAHAHRILQQTLEAGSPARHTLLWNPSKAACSWKTAIAVQAAVAAASLQLDSTVICRMRPTQRLHGEIFQSYSSMRTVSRVCPLNLLITTVDWKFRIYLETINGTCFITPPNKWLSL